MPMAQKKGEKSPKIEIESFLWLIVEPCSSYIGFKFAFESNG
jgi:hypothetical protein